MTTLATQDQSPSRRGPFLCAVTSLNVQRRNDALYLLACEYERPLTPYDICKTLVLSDVFQVISSGKVIFGGRLYAMPFGPVSERTLDDCKRWMTRLLMATMLAQQSPEQQPLQPTGWTGLRSQIPEFSASPEYHRRNEASWDWFSDAEQKNIRRAYEQVVKMTWAQSQAYFHEPISAIGYAYDFATKPFSKPFKGRVEMNWFDVLEGVEKIEGADVSHARAMLGLWA